LVFPSDLQRIIGARSVAIFGLLVFENIACICVDQTYNQNGFFIALYKSRIKGARNEHSKDI
jgi:hypothetical protein